MAEECKTDELIDYMYRVMDDSDEEDIPFVKEVIKELEMLKTYKKIGTPSQIYEKIGGLNIELGKYVCIGTVEEFKCLKENQKYCLGYQSNDGIKMPQFD